MKNKLVYSWYNSGQLYARGTHFFFAHPDVLQSFRSILNYDEAKFIINFGQQCRERIGEDLFIVSLKRPIANKAQSSAHVF